MGCAFVKCCTHNEVRAYEKQQHEIYSRCPHNTYFFTTHNAKFRFKYLSCIRKLILQRFPPKGAQLVLVHF